MARSIYDKKGMVESGGGSGSGGSIGWRAGSDMGLKGLARGGPRTTPASTSSSTPAEPSYPSSAAARGDYLKGQVEQSVKDAGGYPTRGGKPMMTRMQQRAQMRQSAFEQNQADTASERAAAQAARKAKFGIKYNKGGMVKGSQNRDYCK